MINSRTNNPPMSIDPNEFIDRSQASNCCGAPILAPDFCSECREHCEAEDIKDEPGYDAPTAKDEQAKMQQVYGELK